MFCNAANGFSCQFCFFDDDGDSWLEVSENFFISWAQVYVVVLKPCFGVMEFEAYGVGGVMFFMIQPGQVGEEILKYEVRVFSEVSGLDGKEISVRGCERSGDETEIVADAFFLQHFVLHEIGEGERRKDGSQGLF